MTAAVDAATLTATITELRDLLAKANTGTGLDTPTLHLLAALYNNAPALIDAAEAGIEDGATIERVKALADKWEHDDLPTYPVNGLNAEAKHAAALLRLCIKELTAALVPRGTDDSIPEEP